MTPQETDGLLRRIAALGNGQAFTRDTGAVWAEALSTVRLQDALEAVPRIARRSRYIDVLTIVQEVARVREERVEAQVLPTPNVDPDDVAGWAKEQQRIVTLVADGTWGERRLEGYAQSGEVLTPGARKALGVGGPVRERPLALEGVVKQP